MRPVTPRFLKAVGASHRVIVEADVYLGDGVWEPVDVIDGIVSLYPGAMRASVDMTVRDVNQYGQKYLSVSSGYIRIRRGLQFFDTGEIELIPLGLFRIHNYAPGYGHLKGAQTARITGYDLMRYVFDARYVAPVTLESGSAVSLLQSQVWGAFGELPIAQLNRVEKISDKTVKPFFVERERSDTVSRLALALAADVSFDGEGKLLIRRASTFQDSPDHAISPGAGAISAAETSTREGTYSAVVVRGERTDGAPPAYHVTYDMDPESATYWNGPFGKVPLFYSSPILVTNAMCSAAGQTLLAKNSGIGRTIDLSQVPNPALEPGDILEVQIPGLTDRIVMVDQMNIPLGPTAVMSARIRVYNAQVETPVTIAPTPAHPPGFGSYSEYKTSYAASLKKAPSSYPANKYLEYGKVTSVVSSDTIVVDIYEDKKCTKAGKIKHPNGKSYSSMRIAVDNMLAPESSWYGGQESTSLLKTKMPVGSRVVLRADANIDADSGSTEILRRSVYALTASDAYRNVFLEMVDEGRTFVLETTKRNRVNRALHMKIAALEGRGLFDPSNRSTRFNKVRINVVANPAAADTADREYATLTNLTSSAIPIASWSFGRTPSWKFPAGASIPAKGSVRVIVGKGPATADTFYMNYSGPYWHNDFDIAYLHDYQAGFAVGRIVALTQVTTGNINTPAPIGLNA